MTRSEMEQLELLAELDTLTTRLAEWANESTAWEPIRRCQTLMQRVLRRVQTLRVRWDAPLVIATFGGTGTGKSALINALLGRECTPTGRQRPTTRQPILIVHTDTDLNSLDVPLEDVKVVRSPSPVLKDIALLDCPDPDTTDAIRTEEPRRVLATPVNAPASNAATEVAAGVDPVSAPTVETADQPNAPPAGSSAPSIRSASAVVQAEGSGQHSTNLQRLRRLLPHCDVLIYTTTQQKYRSARVSEELRQAATG
ncbi:MAG: hypothetical protein GXP27_20810, partial [Planctomycetes bacterium]|nr:hypothetical protein [Planctomycetota bacterium]